jgi:hypothetical protein
MASMSVYSTVQSLKAGIMEAEETVCLYVYLPTYRC